MHENMSGHGTYMTAKVFSERIGVNPATLARWVNAGKVVPAFVSPGGRRFYSEEQVSAYFNGTLSIRTAVE